MSKEAKTLSVAESVALKLIAEDKREAVKAVLLGEEGKVELMEAVLEDGETKIYAEAWEEGREVFVITEDEERIPAPEGEHKLQTGETVVVDSEGKIVEVRAKVEEEEEMSKEDANAEILKRLEALETKLSEAEEGRKAAETKLSETEDALTKVQEEFTKLSASPAEEAPTVAPIPKEKVKLSAQEEEKKLASMSPRERALYEFDKRQN